MSAKTKSYPNFLFIWRPKSELVLLQFLNQVWLNHIPYHWRKAAIIPILKKEKEADTPDNFGPITLRSVDSKLFARILVRRLVAFRHLNKPLSTNHDGFNVTVAHWNKYSDSRRR